MRGPACGWRSRCSGRWSNYGRKGAPAVSGSPSRCGSASIPGYCNVGNFGSDDRMDYTIIGAEVNLAARIEAAADPGGILISYPTYALVRDIVRAEERGSIDAKGIRREVRVFAVAGILDDRDPA